MILHRRSPLLTRTEASIQDTFVCTMLVYSFVSTIIAPHSIIVTP